MESVLPQMSLKAAGVKPVAFQGSVFTPQTADTNILINSLAKMEARQERAAEKKSAVDKALAGIEEKINVKELPWFNAKKEQVQQQIQNEIDAGDYGAAIKVATNLADEVLLGADTQNRIKAQTKYLSIDGEQKKRLEKGEIDQSTYNWWKDNNPYQYADEYDENGKIIGGEYKPNFIPKNSINWEDVVYSAFKRITPDKNSTTKQWNTTTVTPSDEGSTTTGGGGLRGTSYERVKPIDIQTVTNMLLQDTDTAQQAYQSYEVALHDFEKTQKEYEAALKNPDISLFEKNKITELYNERYKFLYKNGSPITQQDFVNKQVTVYAKALGYNWKTGNRSDTSVNKDQKQSQNTTSTGNGVAKHTSSIPVPPWQQDEKGPDMQDTDGSGEHSAKLDETVSGMGNMIEQATR